MKSVIKSSKSIARAKINFLGEEEESFSSWTQYSYGTVREGAKLPAWGSSPVKVFLISSL